MITVEHTFTATARCPIDGAADSYVVVVRVNRTITVEEILATVARLTSEPILQEQLTSDLARELLGTVETVGVHSGVTTRVIAS